MLKTVIPSCKPSTYAVGCLGDQLHTVFHRNEVVCYVGRALVCRVRLPHDARDNKSKPKSSLQQTTQQAYPHVGASHSDHCLMQSDHEFDVHC